jgi:hypothetical protein
LLAERRRAEERPLLEGALRAAERLLDPLERLLDPLERLFDDGLRAEACLALDARVFEPAPLLELDAGREVERFDVRDFVWAIVVPLLLVSTRPRTRGSPDGCIGVARVALGRRAMHGNDSPAENDP